MQYTKSIQIVLVEPSHPGNIGAVARAMKTMGLSALTLVNPTENFPNAESTVRAAGADDILVKAKSVPDLDGALNECELIIGTSARDRRFTIPLLSPEQCAELIFRQPDSMKIGIMFGRENSGLTNAELNRCHYHVHIPSVPDFSSLNLASAVQILCYEIRKHSLKEIVPTITDEAILYATDHEIQLFYERLETTLKDINFLREHSPRKLMTRLRRMFNRTHLEKTELDLLMGILKKCRVGKGASATCPPSDS